MTKTCTKCDIAKPATSEYFHKHREYLRPDCKECKRAGNRKGHQKNRDTRLKYKRERYEKNKDAVKEYRQTDEYKAKRSAYRKKRRKEDPAYRLRDTVSTAVHHALTKSKGSKSGKSTFQHLPYTPEQLKEHLQTQFDEHMTWDNYGSYWHVDHIYPQSLLPYDSLEHENFHKCWALDNLQPLEAIENIRKSNKTTY